MFETKVCLLVILKAMDINIKHIEKIIISACDVELLPRFNDIERNYKTDGSIVTEADLRMQDLIESQLKQAYPDIALLGEEMTKEQQHALLVSGSPVWCLDPIDGTSNFASGLPYFAVSLALIENRATTLALIYDPVRKECFHAQSGKGAFLNEQALLANKTGLDLAHTLALIDFKRLTSELATKLIENRPYGSQRSLGSIALELCWIAAGRAHIYLHAKQHLWDYAAAQLILSEAGAKSCRLDGNPLTVDELTPQSTVAALDEQLFKQWCDFLDIKVN